MTFRSQNLRMAPLFCAFILCLSARASGWGVINPYENQKPFSYKASLHNHSNYHPEWLHAPVPSDERLRAYRDYDTEPKYGIV
jgi:hypothetical protein